MVSVNLAISLAQAGLKTLLVGADLRKPMMAKTFGLELIPGLTDIVLGNYPWADTVKSITDIIMGKLTMDEVMMTPGMDNLHIITSGIIPPNPAELIESRRLMDFIEEAKKQYDMVIFDSTPILSTADAAILGTKVDGVLLVYRIGAVSRGLLKRSAAQLEQVNCNIIGVVLNGMKADISPDFQDFKYYKYYSYYGEEDEEKKPGLKKVLSFISEKLEDRSSFARGDLSSSVGKTTQAGQEKKKGHFLKWLLIIVALLFLTVGVLWQNGMIDPMKFFDQDSLKPNVKMSSKTADKKSLKAVPTRPEDATIPIPERKPIFDTVAPGPLSDVKSEEKAVIEETVSPYRAGSHPYSLYLGSFR
ncbi:MAG: CpsD/CapB family tyrosine-protein kinase, partial [Deltaproteobacteria bacterium]|nr:CpsD/CapB family tyrosine-protein kinase [Deltaproteobacteria bacterium]